MYCIYIYVYISIYIHTQSFFCRTGKQAHPTVPAKPSPGSIGISKSWAYPERHCRRRPACSDIVCIISSKSYYARAAFYGKCPKAQSPIGIRIYVDVLMFQFGLIQFNHNSRQSSIVNHISLFWHFLQRHKHIVRYICRHAITADLAWSYSGHFMRNSKYIFHLFCAV